MEYAKSPAMKFLLLCLLAIPLLVASKEDEKPSPKDYKVVFEVSIEGVENWEAALRNALNTRKALGDSATTVEIVAHGKGIGLLLLKTATTHPELGERIQTLHKAGVVFAACENTMARMKLVKEDLEPAAITVDSGVAEVVRKQTEGWAYIKTGG